MIIEAIIYLIILATVIPVGLFLSKLCDDELIKDQIYFRLISYLLIIAAVTLLIFKTSFSVILALIYVVLLLEVLIYKSKNLIKKTRKK